MNLEDTLKILVFDMHPITRKGIRMMLNNITMGENVTEAISLNQFYKHLSDSEFDLIVVSVNEPDSFDSRKLSGKLPRTALLYTEEGAEEAIDIMAMGAGACMSKKCVDIELREGISAVLTRRRHACAYTRALADTMVPQGMHF
ncbi:hypothetical protein LZD49_26550 [Dyadobacter sp. CY261]|uniref:hypothetical protein n=1 Tax=Dyadobacter sp. CY261 TaxID=2907203 RepID=UPI001F1E56AE|nr:hypothetical protein [Dyadobacter sp. CY261]MCF0074071.1 hypothetical protein [Dyadobacter sp. CY261]